MNSLSLRLAIGCVRAWTRLYTWRMPPALRETRRAEIESDLWEFQADATDGRSVGSALHILIRLLSGMPDDLGWCVEQSALAGTLTQGSIALIARVAGAALFICTLWVIDADASRSQATPRSTTAASGPVFEVASIKRNPTGVGGPTTTQIQPGGRFIATNIPVLLLIGQAYQVQGYRLFGGPHWITTDRFDINTKANVELFPRAGVRPLDGALRALLAERFKLIVHFETRQLPIYELVLARSDGRLGPNLTRSSTTDCEAVLAVAHGRGGGPPPPPGGAVLPCTVRTGDGTFSANGRSPSQLAGILSAFVEGRVVDQTGLAGLFDAELTWTPDRRPLGAADPAPTDPDAPSIFTAVQEQLGLKLRPATGPVDVLIIDRVQRPTPD
jgi:uncharacterized protein (TIGR03435 family)